MKELGSAPVGKLLRRYAIPSIIAMTASSLYNMVDSIFIGRGVGAMALGGLAVTFPFMNLAAAFGALIGVGTANLISIKLGQKNYGEARRTLGNVVSLNVILGLLFMAVSLIWLDPILVLFGASDNTLQYAHDYMQIILYGNVVTHMYLGLNTASRAVGHPNRAMYATILTVVLNAVLDPLFIFSFGWGVRGAAIATILAQVVSLTWLLVEFAKPKERIHLQMRNLIPDIHIVRKSLSIGVSPFVMNSAACLIVIFINRGLMSHGGDYAVSAFGIVNRFVFIFAMIVLGVNQGMQPIAGYNFGAQMIDRLFKVLKLTIFWATVIMTLQCIVAQLIPEMVARLFTTDPLLIDEAAHGMRLFTIAAPIVGFSMVTSNFFQSIGMAPQSIFLSLTRQILFLLPLLVILPRFWGVSGIWYSIPISDTLAFICSAVMLIYHMKKFRREGLHTRL